MKIKDQSYTFAYGKYQVGQNYTLDNRKCHQINYFKAVLYEIVQMWSKWCFGLTKMSNQVEMIKICRNYTLDYGASAKIRSSAKEICPQNRPLVTEIDLKKLPWRGMHNRSTYIGLQQQPTVWTLIVCEVSHVCFDERAWLHFHSLVLTPNIDVMVFTLSINVMPLYIVNCCWFYNSKSVTMACNIPRGVST